MTIENSLKFVGRSMPPRDGFAKVTGRADYAADRNLPRMTYARVLGSAFPHAKVKSIDTKRAVSLSGVRAVITCFDVPVTTFQPVETKELTALVQHARCLGDEIAAVAADTEEIAEQALALLKVEYEVLPAVFDARAALQPEAPQLYPEGNQSMPGGPLKEEWGNVDTALANSYAVAEGTFTTPIQVPTPIEPRACVAKWSNGSVEIWASTQFPHRVRADIAQVIGLNLNQVRVHNMFVGGGFGGKKEERYPVIASLLAQRAERPVKLEYTREDEHTIARRRYAATMQVRLGCDKDGCLTAIEFNGWYNVGAYGNAIGGSLLFLLSEFIAYQFPNGRFTAWDVNTNLVTAQPFRGVQAPAFHFAIEQLLDELARQMNMDPVEFRHRNTYRSNSVTKPFGEIISAYPIEECLNKGKQIFSWNEKWKGWQPTKVSGSKIRAVGMASSLGWCDWERAEMSVVIEIQKDGSAVIYTGTSDIGTDSRTTLAQIAAEALGMPYEMIDLVAGDTSSTPFDHGCCASRTLFLAGLAIKKAAEDVRGHLIELTVAKFPNLPVSDLYIADGMVRQRGSDDIQLPIKELIHHSIFGRGYLEKNEEVAPMRSKYYVGGALAHFAEVEVDTETGEVKVLNLVAVHDVGRAINPAVVENQIYGGATQGIGYALTEELRFDPETNRYLEDSYTDYKIPTIGDIPRLTAVIVEDDEPLGPYGAKGVGEHALNCTAGAIANAVKNAIGKMVPEIPMTPERVLKWLGKN